MTRIKGSILVLKYTIALARLGICYGLCKICEKLNPKANLTIFGHSAMRATEDIMDVLLRLGLYEQYEEIKRLYDESF